MQERMPRPRSEVREQNRIIFFFLGATVLTFAMAPWVWPIGCLAGLIAGAVNYLARKGLPVVAAGVACAAGLIGGVFTLPASSAHSFWVRQHWSNPQNSPVLSLYAVALLVWGATLFFLWRRQRETDARQTG